MDWRGRIGALGAPAEISLRAYLWLALLVRVPAAMWSRGYEFRDHQFQYVDPAYMLALGGSWWQCPDYVQGDRSWVYPGLLAGVFDVVAWLGIDGPEAMMAATRFVHALASLLPVLAFWLLVVRWRGLRGQRPLLLLFACNPVLVYCAVQPTGITFAAGLSLAAIFVFQGPRPLHGLLAGLLLGLAFACRFQDALFGLVLLGWGLRRGRRSHVAWFCAGAALMLAGQGLVDLCTWGAFLHSPLRYLRTNLVEGEAALFSRPAWFYLPIVAGLCVLVPPFLRSGFAALRDGARAWPLLMAAGVFYLGLHTLVPHKAFRFVMPALVLVVTACSAGLLEDHPAPLRRLHRRVFVGVQLALLVAASVWYFHRGPVEAAKALGREPEFRDHLVLVDGDLDAMGGHYWFRRPKVETFVLTSAGLAGWLEGAAPATTLFLMVCGHPLSEGAVPAGWRLREVGMYTDLFDLKESFRRWLYRVDKESR